MIQRILRRTTWGSRIFLLVLLLGPIFLSFLFPKWTYVQIHWDEKRGTRLLKYEAPRTYRFSPPPLDIDRTIPGWAGLEKSMHFDVAEPGNGWMLFEWAVTV